MYKIYFAVLFLYDPKNIYLRLVRFLSEEFFLYFCFICNISHFIICVYFYVCVIIKWSHTHIHIHVNEGGSQD